MNTEENDPLWRLLGEAKPPTVSAFFSRNVIREIRASNSKQERRAGIFVWLLRHGHIAGAALAAVVVMAGVGIRFKERPQLIAASAPKQEVLVAQQLAKNPDSELIKNLDELLASDDNSLWLDNSAQ